MAMRVAAIYRYPVKGLSAEKLERVRLAPGECLPHDRRFALALPSTRFDPERPEWVPKSRFAMLMRDGKLARLGTRFDAANDELTIEQAGAVALRASLTEPAGCQAIGEFIGEFLGAAVERPLRVVAARGHAFADARRKPNATTDKYVSLINLASIAALEERVGAALDPLRFRANVYFEGAPAWEELDWIEVAPRGRRRAAAGHRGDHPLRRDAGEPDDGGTRHRCARRSATRVRPQSDGDLRRNRRRRRHRRRRRAGADPRILPPSPSIGGGPGWG